MMKQKNMKKATEEYVKTLYYHKVYNPATCWKRLARVVNDGLKILWFDASKQGALQKKNIKISVIGYGWNQ